MGYDDPKILITIDKMGNETIEVQGLPGVDCKTVTEFLESMGTVKASTPTADMSADKVQVAWLKAQNGG